MSELSKASIESLVQEILSRQDEVLREDGQLHEAPFVLADFLGTRVSVDGAPVRRNGQGDIELMAIKRNSGPYAGMLSLVGGGVGRVKQGSEWVPEDIGEALSRHFQTDLGFDIEPVTSWDEPQYLAQDMRPVEGKVQEGFSSNPTFRHLVAARYLVSITGGEDAPAFGSTEYGGQEASDIVWFGEAAMPELSAFGYGHGRTYQALFPMADRLLV
jgi:ADP-ribose pyrophosphatase YjhB (NUDIX family)